MAGEESFVNAILCFAVLVGTHLRHIHSRESGKVISNVASSKHCLGSPYRVFKMVFK